MNWNQEVIILGHRGYMAKYTENSFQGFEKALEDGANGFELDVWLTKDKEVIIMHDDSVNRTTDSEGRIKNLTLNELKEVQLTNNEKIPTLKEVLQKFQNIKINVEIKDIKAVDKTIEVIEKYNAESRILISSFNKRILRKTRKKNKKIRLGILIGNFLNLIHLPDITKEINLFSVNLPIEGVVLTLKVYKEILKWIKNLNLKVVLWAMNDNFFYQNNNLKKLSGLYDILIPNNIEKINSHLDNQ